MHQRVAVISTVEIAREMEDGIFRVRSGSFAIRAIFFDKVVTILSSSDKLDGTIAVVGDQ